MSQTNALSWRVKQEFKTEFSSIGRSAIVQKVSQRSGMDWGGSVSVCASVCVCVCVCVHVCIYDSL